MPQFPQFGQPQRMIQLVGLVIAGSFSQELPSHHSAQAVTRA